MTTMRRQIEKTSITSPSMTRQVIAAVTTPLGCFVLALLIVESFLGIVLVFASLESPDRMECVRLGVRLFIFVVTVVSVFTWFKPKHLTFGKREHLEDDKYRD